MKTFKLNEVTQVFTHVMQFHRSTQVREMLSNYAAVGSSDASSLLDGLIAGAVTTDQKDLIYKVTFQIIKDGIPNEILAGNMSVSLMVQVSKLSPHIP